MNEHLYIVTYDISDQKRWRSIFKLMQGYGEWVQLSVFQCRLTDKHYAEMVSALQEIIHHKEDHVLMIDLGIAERVAPRVASMGKKGFEPVSKEPVIV